MDQKIRTGVLASMNDGIKQKFLSELQRIGSLSQISSLLGWDEQVNLPPGSSTSEQRASQRAVLATLLHREFTSADFQDKLRELEQVEPDPNDDWTVILREVRRKLDRATKIPSEFVARKTAHQSNAYHAWRKARQNDDFASYAPCLEVTLQLAREEASFAGYGDNPYDYHLDMHDPGMDTLSVANLFAALQVELVPLSQRILGLAEHYKLPELKNFPVAKQEIFLREIVESLGFDFSRGRIDVAIHPFCSGNGNDTRLTTRYDPNNPLDSLFSSIHEAGHGLYEQGLPAEWLCTPLGEAAGMAVHESQSRIWENQVGRSRQFWHLWEPRFRELFPEALSDISSEELFKTINLVAPNPIRVDADEVTYNLHVILRFELEQALFSGELEVRELPDAWNQKAENLLNLRPENDAEGVLQDVHWSSGSFGYFPSYCIGNLLAAQLWETAKEDLPELESLIEAGEHDCFQTWLGEKVHRHGSRMNLLELTEHATGKPLGHAPLLRYLEERYLALYEQN